MSTPEPRTTRAPRTPPAEARRRLIKATIELLRTRDPIHVTVRDITAAAGLNMAHISRYFGSRGELFFAAAEELHRSLMEHLERTSPDNPLFILQVDDIRVRLSIAMALADEGFDLTRFQPSQQEILAATAAYLAKQRNLPADLAELHAMKVQMLIQSMHLMNAANGFTPEQLRRLALMVNEEVSVGTDTATRLGWA